MVFTGMKMCTQFLRLKKLRVIILLIENERLIQVFVFDLNVKINIFHCLLFFFQKMEPKEEVSEDSSQEPKISTETANVDKTEDDIKQEIVKPENQTSAQHEDIPVMSVATEQVEQDGTSTPPTVIRRNVLTTAGKIETSDEALEIQNEEIVNTSEISSPEEEKMSPKDVSHEVASYQIINQDPSNHLEHYVVTTEGDGDGYQQTFEASSNGQQSQIYTLEIPISEGTTVPVTIETANIDASADYANLETAQYANGQYPADGSQYLQQRQYNTMQYQLDNRSSGENSPININSNVLVRSNDPILASSRYHQVSLKNRDVI